MSFRPPHGQRQPIHHWWDDGKFYEKAGFEADDTLKIIPMPHVSEITAPIFYTVPMQLLSYHVALIKGTDVDQPRNLAKAVTVE